MSPQKSGSRVPGAAGFTGMLVVSDLLPAGACMHAPGTPRFDGDGQVWTMRPGTMQARN